MSFLAPLFLFGALAVALPIVFHLIRRTPREKLPFSSLMFLEPSPPRVTRRSRLEHIFLLLLRCLVFCLLALGFARPFLHRPAAAERQAGDAKKIVVLVDTSASMRRGSLWPEARAKAEEVLKKTAPADQVAVFTFDRQTRPLVTFEQWSSMPVAERAALTAGRLAQVAPGWSPTYLGNALVTAAEALDDAGKQEPRRKQIVLISDLQEGSRLDGLPGYEWPRGLETIIQPLKVKRSTNAGLQWVADLDELASGGSEAGPRVRVSNAADSKREQFQIGWTRPGEKGWLGAPVDVYVPPGQSRVFQAPRIPPGLTSGQLMLSGDDEDFDNTIYFVPPRAEQIKILFLGDDPEKDPTQPLYFVKRAFLQTRRQIVQVIASPTTKALPGESQEAPLMIVTDALPDDRVPAVKQFLSGHRTVLLAMKNAAAARTIARLLDLAPLEAEEASTAGYAMLGQIDFEHPLFAPFADPRYSDFTKIHFWKHRRLSTDKIPGARVLARFDNGDAALIEIHAAAGTLLVLTSGWQPEDSQLALSSKFVPLLYSILEQSGGVKAEKSQYVIGDTVALPGLGAGSKPTVRKPDGAAVTAGGSDKAGQFAQTDLPGIYSVASAPAPFQFAVNLAAEESRTAPLALDELERRGVPLKEQPLATAKQVEQKRRYLQATELENQQKLWRWLIVGAFMVLMLETWLAGLLTRRAGAQAETQT